MLIEEEEGKVVSEINPDAIDAALAETDLIEEEEVIAIFAETDERSDEVDLAFVEDEGYW